LGYVKQLHGMGKTYEEIAQRCGTTSQNLRNMVYKDKKRKEAEAEKPKRGRGRPKGSKNKRTIAEEKMLTNWESFSLSPAMREDKADLNRAAGWFVTECLKLGQSTDIENLDTMYEALQKYVALCTQCGMPMLVKTCQLALGINGRTFSKWRNGTARSNDPRYREFAELVDSVIGAGMEASSAAGAVDKVLLIWWEKAHFNMIEGTGRETSNNDPLGERKSAKEIAEKYGDLPD
jgi:predicted transcriptional regulator